MPTIRLQRLVAYTVAVLALVLPAFSLADFGETLILKESNIFPAAYGNFGQDISNEAALFELTPASTSWFCYNKLRVSKNGSPTDDLEIIVNTDFDGASLTGSQIASASLDNALIPIFPEGDEIYSTFNYPNCFPLYEGQTYWFLLHRKGASDTENYYMIEGRFAPLHPEIKLWLLYYHVWTLQSSMYGLDFYGDTDLSGLPMPNFASTSSPFSDCSVTDIACQIGNVFYKAITYLFIPSTQALNQFVGLWDMIKMKPPVGYFTATKDAFDNLTVASGSFAVVMSGMDGITTPLKTGLTWIFWLMLAFWILHRIRQLEI